MCIYTTDNLKNPDYTQMIFELFMELQKTVNYISEYLSIILHT